MITGVHLLLQQFLRTKGEVLDIIDGPVPVGPWAGLNGPLGNHRREREPSGGGLFTERSHEWRGQRDGGAFDGHTSSMKTAYHDRNGEPGLSIARGRHKVSLDN